MKFRKFAAFVISFVILLCLASCADGTDKEITPGPSAGQIYLYGEAHGVEKILEKEAELWKEYYDNEGMCHLFIEHPYYTAEFLNVWMREDSDDILDAIYNDWAGTQAQVPTVKEFFQKIKYECPETVFHGTDVGHQHRTTGRRFLEYLEQNGLKDSVSYALAQEALEQGQHYYGQMDSVYRENKMAENFIREFEALNGESIMGIYGAAHTGIDALDFTRAVPCMANQLAARYSEAVHSEDLSYIAKEIAPIRTDTITVDGKEYTALYYGTENMSWSAEYIQREIWCLENAYDDFKNLTKTGEVLPYNNYPMHVEAGQVFVIDYTKTDGSVVRMYYRSDGIEWQGLPSTEEIAVE